MRLDIHRLAAFTRKPDGGNPAGVVMLDAWLRIDPAGTVTVFTGKVELGQGILTAIAQIAADELDIDLAQAFVLCELLEELGRVIEPGCIIC